MLTRPRLIQIVPVRINGQSNMEIYQISVEFNYRIDQDVIKDFIVFERSATSSDTKWRVCGRIEPNDQYYKF